MNQFQLQLQFRKSRAANQIGGFFVRFLGIWKRISQKTSSTMLRNSNRNWNSQLHNFLRSIQRRFGFQIDPAGFVDIRKNIHFRKLKAIQFFRSNDERVAVAAQFRSNWLFGIENCNFQGFSQVPLTSTDTNISALNSRRIRIRIPRILDGYGYGYYPDTGMLHGYEYWIVSG